MAWRSGRGRHLETYSRLHGHKPPPASADAAPCRHRGLGQRLVQLSPETRAGGGGTRPASTQIEPLIRASWNDVSMVSSIKILGLGAEKCISAVHSLGRSQRCGAIRALWNSARAAIFPIPRCVPAPAAGGRWRRLCGMAANSILEVSRSPAATCAISITLSGGAGSLNRSSHGVSAPGRGESPRRW